MGYSEALEHHIGILRKYERYDGPAGWEGPLARLLRRADTFYVGAHVGEAVWQAGVVLPAFQLELAYLPSPHGFVWLERPVWMQVDDEHETAVHAISWGACRRGTAHGAVIQADRSELDGIVVGIHGALGITAPLMVMYQSSWFFGDPLEAGGPVQDQPVGTWTDWDTLLIDRCRRFLAALLVFMGQRILVGPEQPAERHVRKRLAREGWQQEPVIRVVQLRRKEGHVQGAGDPTDREWHCQWVVSGHWRQQWHPKSRTHQPRWILPYVKGPEDKPLKAPRATVFAVVR